MLKKAVLSILLILFFPVLSYSYENFFDAYDKNISDQELQSIKNYVLLVSDDEEKQVSNFGLVHTYCCKGMLDEAVEVFSVMNPSTEDGCLYEFLAAKCIMFGFLNTDNGSQVNDFIKDLDFKEALLFEMICWYCGKNDFKTASEIKNQLTDPDKIEIANVILSIDLKDFKKSKKLIWDLDDYALNSVINIYLHMDDFASAEKIIMHFSDVEYRDMLLFDLFYQFFLQNKEQDAKRVIKNISNKDDLNEYITSMIEIYSDTNNQSELDRLAKWKVF
ncbi:MAG: hypothetical protein HZB76_00935 [Chlamydiae bacterium]|nr:hypothetical protein [Chlamydiota bacterium]